MPKAILELDYMPKFCGECVFCKYHHGVKKWLCGTSNDFKVIGVSNYKRADFCPLKEVQK